MFTRIVFGLVLLGMGLFLHAADDEGAGIEVRTDTSVCFSKGGTSYALMDRYCSKETDEEIGNLPFWVEYKRTPKPHVEFIQCDTITVWETSAGTVNPKIGDATVVTVTSPEDWGMVHTVTATPAWYEIHKDSDHAKDSHTSLGEAFGQHAFVTPKIELQSVSFNYKPGHESDAFKIRTSYGSGGTAENIEAPEWTPEQDSAVAYVGGISPTLKATFKVEPSVLDFAKVNADDESSLNFTGDLEKKEISSFDDWTEEFPGQHAIPKMIDFGFIFLQWNALAFEGISVGGWQNFIDTLNTGYTTLDKPEEPWKQDGSNQRPWVDALEFTIQRCGTNGKTAHADALHTLTAYLFASNHGKEYDIIEGAPHYMPYLTKAEMDNIINKAITKATEENPGITNDEINEIIRRKSSEINAYLSTKTLFLVEYMNAGGIVNCEDQARTLATFSRLLGCKDVSPIYHPRFGYIQIISLIGRGDCNNPFYGGDGNPSSPIINDLNRTAFRMHYYVDLGGNIYDSCGGPSLGIPYRVYYQKTVDAESNRRAGWSCQTTEGSPQGLYQVGRKTEL